MKRDVGEVAVVAALVDAIEDFLSDVKHDMTPVSAAAGRNMAESERRLREVVERLDGRTL